MFKVVQAVLPEIRELLRNRDLRALKVLISEFHAAEIEDIISEFGPHEAVLILKLLPPEKAAEVISNLHTHNIEKIIAGFSDKQLLEIIDEMDDDDRTSLFEELPPNLVKKILSLLSPEEREVALTLLNYPENSCGRLMNTEFVALNGRVSVREALESLRKADYPDEVLLSVYVLDDDQRLKGQVKLTTLVKSDENASIERLAERVPFVSAYDPAWKASKIMADYDLLAIPVVDSLNRLLGVITIDDVVDVIVEEGAEDFMKFAAVSDPEERYFLLPLWDRIKKRLPWLVVLVVLANLPAMVIESYSYIIKEAAILAAFIPMLNGMAGNVSTQCSSFIIRALATGEINLSPAYVFKLWTKEMVGVLFGLAVPLAVIAALSAFLRTHDPMLSAVIALAMVISTTLGNTLGFFLPLIVKRLGLDPASASAPLTATLNDPLASVVYFTVARLILHL